MAAALSAQQFGGLDAQSIAFFKGASKWEEKVTVDQNPNR
jgi:hypothetical protein